MARVVRAPRRRDSPELLDSPGLVGHELAANLRDIRRLNRWFGGTSLALSAARVLTEGTSWSLLDVATGSADIPVAIVRWAKRRGMTPVVIATDVSPEVLAEARAVATGSGVDLRLADARDLVFPDASIDVVTCNLALHHFAPSDATRVLSEMWRVARRGIVVSDLTRGRTAYLATWLATRVIARNRLTRHDGPLSVLRAYTPSEMTELAERAGVENFSLRRRFPFRQVLIGRKVASGGRDA